MSFIKRPLKTLHYQAWITQEAVKRTTPNFRACMLFGFACMLLAGPFGAYKLKWVVDTMRHARLQPADYRPPATVELEKSDKKIYTGRFVPAYPIFRIPSK